ncbi:MAG: hypothetical protein QOE34_1390 [Verrucomicrobiota bacterium]
MQLLVKWSKIVWKFLDVGSDHVVPRKGETTKPERGKLIQDRAFARNWIGENNIEGRKPIGRDEEKSFAEVKNFADFAAAKLFYSRQVE